MLQIYVGCLSHHPQWQVHLGHHLSKEFYEALKFTAIASASETEGAGGRLGYFCLLIFFFRFTGARQDFRGHLILLLDPRLHALILNSVTHAVIFLKKCMYLFCHGRQRLDVGSQFPEQGLNLGRSGESAKF